MPIDPNAVDKMWVVPGAEGWFVKSELYLEATDDEPVKCTVILRNQSSAHDECMVELLAGHREYIPVTRVERTREAALLIRASILKEEAKNLQVRAKKLIYSIGFGAGVKLYQGEQRGRGGIIQLGPRDGSGEDSDGELSRRNAETD